MYGHLRSLVLNFIVYIDIEVLHINLHSKFFWHIIRVQLLTGESGEHMI